MPRKKILYVITKLELGGAQKHVISLIQHLDKQRYEIFLFTAREGLLCDEALSLEGLKVRKSKFLERPIHPFKDLLAFYELYTFIKANNIDIVHTHSSKAGILGRFAARLARVRIIVHTVHGWSFNDYQPFFVRMLYVYLERYAARVTHALIIVSHHDREKGLIHNIGKAKNYVLIRYGIDYSEFHKGEDKNARREWGFTADTPVAAMISCFKPQKSPEDFVRLANFIVPILPKMRFILIGDGILRKNIVRLIKKFKLKERVKLLGWRNDIPRILSAVDVFVLTSLWEGLPITVLEAMASSKPVVVTDTGGVREVVRDGATGFVVRPRDTRAMAQRVIQLFQNRDLRMALGRNAALSLRQDFDYRNMISHMEKLYDTLSMPRKEQHG